MKVRMNITNDIKGDMLNIHITFKEKKEEFALIVLTSAVAYLTQYKNATTNGKDKIYIDHQEVGELTQTELKIDLSLNTKLINLKTNPMMMFVGLQTYFNIYFNLYESNKYSDVVDYFKTVEEK